MPNKTDITHYNVKIEIVEAESGMLANLLPDVTAFTAKLNPATDSIFSEEIGPDNPYFARLANVIVSRTDDTQKTEYKKVVEAYHKQNVAQTLKDAYKGAFIPVWAGSGEYKLK